MTDNVSHASAAPVGHGPEDTSHGGIGKYIAVFFALCVLTSMSFWTSPESTKFFPIAFPFLGDVAITRIFTIGVSCAKALLVILFFMHVKYEANWKYVLTIPAGMMSIFLMLMLVPDVGMRWRHASPERAIYAAQPNPVAAPQHQSPPAGEPAAHEVPGTE